MVLLSKPSSVAASPGNSGLHIHAPPCEIMNSQYGPVVGCQSIFGAASRDQALKRKLSRSSITTATANCNDFDEPVAVATTIRSAQDVIASLCAKALAVEQAHKSISSQSALLITTKTGPKEPNRSCCQTNSIAIVAAQDDINANMCAKSSGRGERDRQRSPSQSSQVTNKGDRSAWQERFYRKAKPSLNETSAATVVAANSNTIATENAGKGDTSPSQSSCQTDSSVQSCAVSCATSYTTKSVEDVIADLISKASRVAILSQTAAVLRDDDHFSDQIDIVGLTTAPPASSRYSDRKANLPREHLLEYSRNKYPQCREEEFSSTGQERLFTPLFLFRRENQELSWQDTHVCDSAQASTSEFVSKNYEESEFDEAHPQDLFEPLFLFRQERQEMLSIGEAQLRPLPRTQFLSARGDSDGDESWDGILFPLVAKCLPDDLTAVHHEQCLPFEFINAVQGRISPLSVPSMMSDCDSKDYTSSDDNGMPNSFLVAENCIGITRGKRRRKWRIYQ